jgi:hypothetical protein
MSRSGAKTWLWIALLALLAGAVASYGAVRIQKTYYKKHPHFYDAVSYQYHNARLYERLKRESVVDVAAEEWFKNSRHPLRTTPLVLFAPELLRHPQGHMATSIPFLLLFLFLTGALLYARTASLAAVALALGGAALTPHFYDPQFGLAAAWLDLTAALIVGCAVLCLFLAEEAHAARPERFAWGWHLAAGALLGLAPLARYVAVLYAFVLAAPVIGWFAWRILQRAPDLRRGLWPAVRGPALTLFAFLAVAGSYLYAHFANNAHFYSTYGYNLGAGIIAAGAANLQAAARFFTYPVSAFLLALLVAFVALMLRSGEAQKRAEFYALVSWCCAAPWLMQSFVLRSLAVHPMNFALPFLLLLFAAAGGELWISARERRGRRLALGGAGVLLALLSLFGIWTHLYRARHPDPGAIIAKAFDRETARRLIALGPDRVWLAMFDERSMMPTMEAYYESGIFVAPAGQDRFFSVHASVFKGNYPGLSIAQMSDNIKQNLDDYVDLAVLPANVDREPPLYNNEYSREVARAVGAALAGDPRWEKIERAPESPYGPLDFYRNRNPRSDHFVRIFTGTAELR